MLKEKYKMKKLRTATAGILLLSLLFMNSCSFATFDKYNMLQSNNQNNDATMATGDGFNAWLPDDMLSSENNVAEESKPSEEMNSVGGDDENNAPSYTQQTVTEAPYVPDVSAYTKEQVLNVYEKAHTLTRSYMGNVTVYHTEAFNAEVKEATPDSSLVKTLANYIVDLVGSEGEQTLNFSDGKAMNKDNETIPILLPQRSAYNLPAEGVVSATASPEGELLHVRIVLVPETVTMGEIPQYNAGAIGYLDTSGMSFKVITISRVDISYTGSVIDAYIRTDGYIQSVTYTINMSTYAEVSGMGISGNGTLEGAQTEKWVFGW